MLLNSRIIFPIVLLLTVNLAVGQDWPSVGNNIYNPNTAEEDRGADFVFD
jgi:hypothetical protein